MISLSSSAWCCNSGLRVCPVTSGSDSVTHQPGDLVGRSIDGPSSARLLLAHQVPLCELEKMPLWTKPSFSFSFFSCRVKQHLIFFYKVEFVTSSKGKLALFLCSCAPKSPSFPPLKEGLKWSPVERVLACAWEWKWCLSQAVMGPEWGRESPSRVPKDVFCSGCGERGRARRALGWGKSKSTFSPQ